MENAKIIYYSEKDNDSNFLLQILINNIVNKIMKDNNRNNREILLKNNRDSFESLIRFNNLLRQCNSYTENICISENLKLRICLAMLPVRGLVTLREVELGNCPAKFAMAFPLQTDLGSPNWKSVWGFSGGRGLTLEESLFGALGEAAECMSVWSRGVGEDLIVPVPNIPDRSDILDPVSLLNLSERQTRILQNKYQASTTPHLPLELHYSDNNNRIMQYQDKSTNSISFVPGLCALAGEELHFGISGERLTSTNGTAVAESVSIASDKAMFELIERDAVSIWWYNRICRDQLPDAVLRSACGDDLLNWLVGRERRFHVLDLSSDVRVPVAGALSYERDGSMIADGYSAGRTWPEAILAAILEMLQAEISLSFMEQKAARDAKTADRSDENTFYAQTRRMNVFTEGFMAGREAEFAASAFDGEVTADDVLTDLTQKGIQVLTADISRTEVGVPAARAVSQQLRDWQPRFGPGRLYDVPVTMGWLEEANTEDTLNPRAFLT